MHKADRAPSFFSNCHRIVAHECAGGAVAVRRGCAAVAIAQTATASQSPFQRIHRLSFIRFSSVMTTDSTTTLADLKQRVLAFARERDWEQFHSPKNLSMALAAETGELMEHFLWTEHAASRARAEEPGRRQKIEEEIADVVIYALEFANVTGIDLASAIDAKLAANALKYPVEKARGRADKYTEL